MIQLSKVFAPGMKKSGKKFKDESMKPTGFNQLYVNCQGAAVVKTTVVLFILGYAR